MARFHGIVMTSLIYCTNQQHNDNVQLTYMLSLLLQLDYVGLQMNHGIMIECYDQFLVIWQISESTIALFDTKVTWTA